MKVKVVIEFDMPTVPHKSRNSQAYLREVLYDHVVGYAVKSHARDAVTWCFHADKEKTQSAKNIFRVHSNWRDILDKATFTHQVLD